MSVRLSASLPSTCSGAMYGRVPRIMPSCVRLSALPAIVGNDESSEGSLTGAIAFASPKSSSLTPDFVNITLPGFRSRWTIPCRCALSRASAISDAVTQRLLERQRAVGQSIRQRLALQVLHDEVLGLAFPSHVIERADVRVRELRDGLGLPLEALPHLRGREMLRQDLHRHGPIQTRIPCPVDLAHPARTDWGEDLVGPEASAGGEGHRVVRILSARRKQASEPPAPVQCEHSQQGGRPRR